ncbi:hypothetical protein T484DRAFT_1768875 [Baffinella frigidus]|nr:hypothetical protein T484DRAFT_1768875 [Cryptophyta sp. CCMP2293]
MGRDGPASRNGSRASSRGILRTASGVDTQPPPYEARHGGYDHFQDTPGGHDHYHDSPAPQRRAKHASSLRTERSQSLKSKRGGGFDAVEVRDAVLRRFGGEVGIAGLGGLPGGPMFGEHSRTDAGETGRIREPAMDYLARLTSPSFGGFSAAPARSAFEKTAPPPANASHAFRQRGGEEWDGKDLGLAGARRGGQATGYVPAGYEAAARVGTAPWMKRPLKREVESLGIKQFPIKVGGDRDRSSIVSMVFSTDGGTLLCGEAQGRVTLFRRNTALDHPQSSRGG